MMEEWELIISCKAAEQEILALTPDLKARFVRISQLLVRLGPNNVGMPHIKPLENKMWEMRLKGKVNIARSIYFIATRKRIVVLHTFIKKTQKAPNKALDLARQEANMTQAEVAKKMNTTQSVIARLEGGKHFPSLQTIHKYSIAVNRAINLHVHP